MGLKWTPKQRAIYDLLKAGKRQEALGKGFKRQSVRDVARSIEKGDKPPEPTPKMSPAGTPLFSATLKTKNMALQPMIAVRFDAVRNALGFGDDYTLEAFLDDSTDLVTRLVGAVPPGFVKEEAVEQLVVPVPAGAQEGKGGSDGGNQ